MAKGSPWVGLMVATALGLSAVEGAVAARRQPVIPTQSAPGKLWPLSDLSPIPTATPPGIEPFPTQLPLAPTQPQTLAETARLSEADRLLQQGIQHFNRSQFREALASWQQALDLYRAQGNRRGEGHALGNLGNAHLELQEYSEAIRFYEQEIAIHREIGNRAGEGSTLFSLGWAYAFQAQYELALDYFNNSLNISHEIGDENRSASILYALGWTYHSLGDFQKALELYQNALIIFEENNNKNGLSNILIGLGWVYIDLDQINLSIDFFRRQLDISQSSSNPRQEANALNGLGFAYAELGEYQTAINYSRQALEIHRDINDTRGEAYALGDIGNAYTALGDYQAALNYLTECLSIQRGLNNRWGEGRTLSSIAQIFESQQQPALAITFLKASVAVRESIREDIRNLDSGLRTSFTDTVADDYRRLADLLLAQGRIPEAQQVLDLLQLEELREFTNTRAVWTGSALAYTEAEQPIADAHGDLIAFGQQVSTCRRTNCPRRNELEQQLTALNTQYRDQIATFQAQVGSQRRDDEVFQDPRRLSSDARALLAANPNSVLIYPFVTEDKLWLLWATPGAVGTVEVAVSQAELSRAVQQLGERLTRGGDLEELQAASQRLYDWLVRPLEAPLAANGIEKLIFVNDRVTRYIPMAVLFDGERYLLERYTLSTVLSPAVTNTTNRIGAVEDAPVLGLGLTQAFPGFNPLPAVREELSGIVRVGAEQGIFPGSVFLDGDFTLEALERNLLGHRVLHIATHAAFVPGRSRDSYILLGDGSRLAVADIEVREHLLADLHLVVLSACQTALGGVAGDGAEIAGISSYFLQPGRADTVIASLWSVNDTSTSVLMQRFYTLLATGELTKAEALRQAQLSLLRGEDLVALGDRLNLSRGSIEVISTSGRAVSPIPGGYGHPYHWAPFILIGNGL